MYSESFQEHYRLCWDSAAAMMAVNRLAVDTVLGRAVAHARLSLERLGFDTSRVDVIQTAGTTCANGHAYLHGTSATAWFSAEEEWSERNALIFAPHELAHAVHYSMQPALAFNNHRARIEFRRLLITEGLATVTSMEACTVGLDLALWGDYLTAENRAEWMAEARRREGELRAVALQLWDQHDEGPFLYTGFADVWRNRGGYYVGAHVIHSLIERHHIALPALFAMDRIRLEELVQFELKVGIPMLTNI